MPIRPERKHLYPRDWARVSFRIRAIRAGWRCEWCDPDGRRCEAVQGWPHPFTGSKVVLTVAHLDHDETHADPTRLMAMCQYHHLRYDLAHHRRNAAETRRRRMGTPDLFADAPCPGAPYGALASSPRGAMATEKPLPPPFRDR